MRAPRAKILFFHLKYVFLSSIILFFLNDRLAAMQFASSPSLFFTKYFFWGQNTVFSLSEYCFWFLKVGISVSVIIIEDLVKM